MSVECVETGPSMGEILRKMHRYLSAAAPSITSPPALPMIGRSMPDASVTREPSLHEILLKIQRDIAEGRPIPLGPTGP